MHHQLKRISYCGRVSALCEVFFFTWQFLYPNVAWGLLRIDIYGFRAFCKNFLAKYPGYFISPLRISGLAMESLFSQFKHNAGGKLDLCNYIMCNSVLLVTTVELDIGTTSWVTCNFHLRRKFMVTQPLNVHISD